VKNRAILWFGLIILTFAEFFTLNESSVSDSLNWTYYKYCTYLAAFCFISALVCAVISGIQSRVDDIKSLIPLKIITLITLVILCIDDSIYTVVWMTLVFLPCSVASAAITFSALSKLNDSWTLPIFTGYLVAIVDIIEIFDFSGFSIIRMIVAGLLSISCVADFWLVLPFKK